MLSKISHNITISAAKRLLETNKKETLSTAKRLLSIAAGAYILQRGIRSVARHPVTSIQEAILGIFLIYDAVHTIKETYPQQPKEPSQIRRNQIQGNDPSSAVPAFV